MSPYLFWLIILLPGLSLQIGMPFPGPGGVAAPPVVTFIQAATPGVNNNGSQFTSTGNITVTSGHFLVSSFMTWASSATSVPNTFTDTLSNIWTQRGCSGLNTSNFQSQSCIYTAVASSTGTDAVTVDIGGSKTGFLDLHFEEYSGATAVDTAAVDCANNNAATTGVTHSVTTTVQDTLLTYTFVAGTNASTLTTPTGFTQRGNAGSGTNNTSKVYDKSAVGAGAQTVANVGTTTNPLHSCLLPIH